VYGWIIKYRDKRKIFRELEGIYWMSKDNFKMWVFNLFLKSVIWKQSVNWRLKMFTKHKPHTGHNVDHTCPRCLCIPITTGSDGMVPSADARRYAIFSERVTVHFSLVTLIFDLWPWHSNSSEREIKHVFSVNLAQIRLRFPRYFIQKQKVTAPKTEPYAAVISG